MIEVGEVILIKVCVGWEVEMEGMHVEQRS